MSLPTTSLPKATPWQKARWARLAGLGALLALALSCAGVLGVFDQGLQQHPYALCLLLLALLAQAHHPHGGWSCLVAAGVVVEEPPPRFSSVFRRLRPSRGPPA